MLRDGKPVERTRMSDIAFDRIREAIVTGELAPGSKVKDSELAEHLGLSRTPVREALARLVDTGLVEAKPAAYTRITTLDRADVDTTLAVIEALDQLAVTSAVPHLTDEMIEAMRSANKDFAKAVKKDDITAALTADDRLHGVIIDAAGNPLLKRLIHQVHPQIHRIYYRKFSSLLGRQDSIDHHNKLIELCAAHDAEEAARLSAQHRRYLGGLIGELFDADEFTVAT
ncbi:GntR family transcriptional regulator [Rhodococcus opacus]|uniref:GntR family transcriptional regulator n=1 Tax=Rhodococcus opacus TaxID=37919 RepID=UPI00280A6052|nr:GntR family transcriptional regulator [Rhodococcus opacus]